MKLRAPYKKKMGVMRILKFANVLALFILAAYTHVIYATSQLNLNTVDLYYSKISNVVCKHVTL